MGHNPHPHPHLDVCNPPHCFSGFRVSSAHHDSLLDWDSPPAIILFFQWLSSKVKKFNFWFQPLEEKVKVVKKWIIKKKVKKFEKVEIFVRGIDFNPSFYAV